MWRRASARWVGAACLLHGLIIGAVWGRVSFGLLVHGQPGAWEIAVGRLVGLLAGSAVLLQLILVSRPPWLEPAVGCDRLFRLHQVLGFVIAPLFLVHPILLVVGGARRHHVSLGQQFMDLVENWPHVWLATVAILLIIPTVVLSLPSIRRRLAHETWHLPHLMMYLAVVLASLHQVNGADLSSRPWITGYWVALQCLVYGGFVGRRIGRPLLSLARHRFRIDRVVAESDDVTSVYLTGRHLDRFVFRAGQYVNVAFLSKGLWTPHPFSFSAAPNGRFIRMSIKSVGDFTRRARELTPGTYAVLEGPLGAFTIRASTRHKYLMVAGGIGITPIRALMESLAAARRDVVLVYAAKTTDDLVFASELRALTARCHFILSRSSDVTASGGYASDAGTSHRYEQGRLDREQLATFVPDVTERDVFLCGPPPMMTAMIGALRQLQVPESQIHREQFS
jgi:predicted ferric reductase